MARSIGHTSFGMTLRHYVDPAVKATVDSRRTDEVLAKVAAGPLGGAVKRAQDVRQIMHGLSAAERAALLQALVEESRSVAGEKAQFPSASPAPQLPTLSTGEQPA